MHAPRRSIAILLAVAVFGAAASGAAQQPVQFADEVLGRWDLTIADETRNTWPSWLEVRLRTEGELMGRFVGQFGSVRHLPEITWNGGVLSFRAPLQYERGEYPLEFNGQLSGDLIEGSMTDQNGRTRHWTGIRAPALARADTPQRGTSIALFNGRDLSGWQARAGSAADCWSVVDAVLTATPPCVDLISQQNFEDFELNVEFNYPAGSNSGIYLHGRYEVQIQDTAGQALDALRMGAVYGFITPTVDAAGAPSEWQSMTIRLVGREVSVVLNGTTIIDAERIPGITGGALDSNEGEPGPIMIQGDHGPIRFRKVELVPLSGN